MTAPAGPPSVLVASAPGRLRLASGGGEELSVALDRRALCRVETGAKGLELESKDALTRTSARDADELVRAAPASLAAHALRRLGASDGLRVVTEWRLPAGSGVDGEAALALSATAAVARALGRTPDPDELVGLAREVAAAAGRSCGHGLPAALWGGVVLTRERDGALASERLAVDPARVEESLMLVDAGEAGSDPAAPPRATREADASSPWQIARALADGRYGEIAGLLARAPDGVVAGGPQGRIVELARANGGAARPLDGRLLAVWALPGAREPGAREAVQAALKAAGAKLVPIRVDLRGLDLD